MLRLAAAALALHVLIGLLVAGTGPVVLDRIAFDAIDVVRGATALDVVRVLTDLGSFPVAVLVTALGAVFAVRARRLPAALGLIAGLFVLLLLVNVAKDLWDRPRPDDRFYDPGGLSYPSGHAAYSTAWLAAATLTERRGLINAAAVVVLAILVSRLYLHVHYLTDVVGGAALGAAVFSLARART